MHNTSIVEYYCTYTLDSEPNNWLSNVLNKASFIFSVPAFLLSYTVGPVVGIIESSLIEESLLAITKVTDISISDFSRHYIIYPIINSVASFTLTHIIAMEISGNDIVVKGISTTMALSALLGSFVFPPFLSKSEKPENFEELMGIKSAHISFSITIGSAIVITCPIIFIAKSIDKLVGTMELFGIVDYSASRTPFTAIPEALYSAGGASDMGYDRYALHNAAALNQIERAIALLEPLNEATKIRALTESDIGDGSTYTAFTLAALHGHKTMIEFFVNEYQKLGIHITSRDEDGKTALMIAAAKGHLEIVRFLDEKYGELGINMDEKDKADNTVMHYIAATLLYSTPSSEQVALYQEIMQLLIKNEVDINAVNHNGKTALEIIAQKNASSVTAHNVAENLDAAHLIGKLLYKDPDISTLIKRMSEIKPSIKNDVGNGKEIFELLLQNNIEQDLNSEKEIIDVKTEEDENFNTLYNIEEADPSLHLEM